MSTAAVVAHTPQHYVIRILPVLLHLALENRILVVKVIQGNILKEIST